MIQATEAFDQLLSDKIAVTITEAKIEVAQNLFGGQLDEAGGWRGHSQAKKADARKAFDNLSDEELNKQILGRHSSLTPQEGAKALEVHHLTGQDEYWNRIKKFHESVELDNYSMEELLDFVVSEDFDRLDELSKKTLGSYIRKASSDRAHSTRSAGVEMSGGGPKRRENIDKHEFHAEKRAVGISKAVDKLTKESIELDDYSIEELLDFVVSEDFDRLDELSKKTLGSYIKKASGNGKNSNMNLAARGMAKYKDDMDGDGDGGVDDDRKAFSRSQNIAKAVDKLTKESFELDEASIDMDHTGDPEDITYAKGLGVRLRNNGSNGPYGHNAIGTKSNLKKFLKTQGHTDSSIRELYPHLTK